VDTRVCAEHGRHHRFHLRPHTHIYLNGHGFTTGRTDFIGCRLSCRQVDVSATHTGALPGKADGNGPANAAPRAGHNRVLVT